MNETILALDLGTVTGWAFGVAGAHASGVWDFKGRRYEGGGMRYLRFERALNEVLTSQKSGIGCVFFEEVRAHAGTDAAHVYGGLLGVLSAWCEKSGIPYAGVPVGTIKKFAAGKGNAGKEAVVAAVRSWGYDPADDNEADAIALLRYAFVLGEASSTGPQRAAEEIEPALAAEPGL